MSKSKIKCVVNHKNLFLSVDGGKLQQMKKGAVIEVNKDSVERHLKNGNLSPISDEKPVKVGKTEG